MPWFSFVFIIPDPIGATLLHHCLWALTGEGDCSIMPFQQSAMVAAGSDGLA